MAQPHSGKARLYTLEVLLLSGPISEEFCEQNPTVYRRIRIRGDQTLATLHETIFEAFDRFDEHLYEFQVGGRRPMDPKARRYSLPLAMDGDVPNTAPGGDVTQATLDSLNLSVDERLCYWFDFGDDWLHQIDVLAIDDEAPPGQYPKITERVGNSPPQYPHLEDQP